MLAGRNWLRKAALLLAVCAGGVGASAPPPRRGAWVADPDDQFLLDVTIRQLRLGDGVRAYNTPEGTCVVLGDFLTTLDVPVRVDLGAKKASGWAFKETEPDRHRLRRAAAPATARKTEPIAPGTIRETPEGWCVQAKALSRWFGIGVRPMTAGSVLLLSRTPSFRSSWRWSGRARRAHQAGEDSTWPACRKCASPIACGVLRRSTSWSARGVTYRAKDGMQGRPAVVDLRRRRNRASVLRRAGEHRPAGHASASAAARLPLGSGRAVCSGPLHATHFGVGDVEGFDSRLSGSSRPVAARSSPTAR